MKKNSNMVDLSRENVGNGKIINGVLCRSWAYNTYDDTCVPFEPKKHAKHLVKKILEVTPAEILSNGEDVTDKNERADFDVILNHDGFNKVSLVG